MPTVPRIQTSNNPALQPFNLVRPTAEPSLEALGALDQGVQKQAGEVLKGVQDVATEAAKKANESRLIEVRNAANTWELENIYGPNGAVNKRGRDAFNVQNELNDSFDKFVSTQEANLSNDAQKRMLAKFAAARKEQVDNWAQQHTSQQVKAYMDEQYAGSLVSSKDRAANDVNKVPVELAFINNQVLDKMAGSSPEAVQAELMKQRSDLHLKVLSSITANGDYPAASSYFERYKDQISSDIKDKVAPVLKESKIRYDAAAKSYSILQNSGSLAEALPKVMDIKDTDLREAVKKQVKESFDLKKQAENDLRDQTFKFASDIIEQNPSREAIPPSIWANLSIEQRNSLDSRAEKLRKGIPVETNWELYYDLKRQAASSDEREAFLKTNLLQYRDRLGDSEFKELTNLQDGVKKGDRISMQDLDGYSSREQILRRTLKDVGLDRNSKAGTPEAKSITRLQRMIDEEVNQQQLATGRKVTNKEYQGIVDGLTIKSVLDPDSFLGRKKRVFEIEKGQSFGVNFNDIPEKDRRDAANALRARNLPVNDQAITSLYMQRVQSLVDKQ